MDWQDTVNGEAKRREWGTTSVHDSSLLPQRVYKVVVG